MTASGPRARLDGLVGSAYGRSIKRTCTPPAGHSNAGGRLRRLAASAALLAAAATTPALALPAGALAGSRPDTHIEHAPSLEFVDFRYLGVSPKQHGLLIELKTAAAAAPETSVELRSEASKKLLVTDDVGTITHTWRRFVVRVRGKAPKAGRYELEVLQAGTYSATFHLSVR